MCVASRHILFRETMKMKQLQGPYILSFLVTLYKPFFKTSYFLTFPKIVWIHTLMVEDLSKVFVVLRISGCLISQK